MRNIHHLAIQVDNIAKNVTWYVEMFGANVEYQDESWAMLKFGNTFLALVLPEQHPYHFAIEMDNAEDFGELKTHRDGTASVYIKDPSGNKVEILKTLYGTVSPTAILPRR